MPYEPTMEEAKEHVTHGIKEMTRTNSQRNQDKWNLHRHKILKKMRIRTRKKTPTLFPSLPHAGSKLANAHLPGGSMAMHAKKQNSAAR